MMRLMYVAIMSPSSSIYQKVQGQIEALQQLKADDMLEVFCWLAGHDHGLDTEYRIAGRRVGWERRGSKWAALVNVVYRYPVLFWGIRQSVRRKKINCLYMRKPPVLDPVFAAFTLSLRLKGCRVLLEVPTYPYQAEMRGHAILRFLESLSWWALRYSIHRVVTISNHDHIRGIPCIRTGNGFSTERVRLRSAPSGRPSSITLVCVAGMAFWHRLDRIIDGLAQYYADGARREVRLVLVGEGAYRPTLESRVALYDSLIGRVSFAGFANGYDLDSIMDRADIGVGNLEESSTRGLQEARPLKHREYAGRGIPFIYGLSDPDFDESWYSFRLEDGPVDVSAIVDWFEKLEVVPQEIRRDALRLTWFVQMNRVLCALEHEAV